MAKFTGHTITSDSALGDAKIQRSLRFDSGSSTYLSRSFASNGNRQTFTISCWVKKTHPSNRQVLVGQIATAGSNEDGLEFDGTVIRFYSYVGGSFVFNLTTNGKFRDVGGWYHVVGVFDSTQATNSNRAKLYVNGTQLTDLSTATYPSQNNTVGYLNTTTDELRIGNMKGNNHKLDGYMTEINFIDGTALDPTYFGFTDPVTGIWMPKRYEGTYGTNGFYLDFSDNTSTTTLGIDKSPNGNDFTLNNLAVTDSMIDTPSNNFATWNAIDGEGKDNLGSFSEGNLKVQIAYQGNAEESGATLSFSSGKWYWEEYMQASTADASMVGVGVKSIEGIYANSGNHWRVRGGSGESDHNGSQTNVSGFSWTTGDIIGIAVDMDAGTWTASKNGTFIGANIHTNLSGTVVPTMHNSNGSERHTFIANFGQDSSFAGTKTAQGYKDASGIGDFYYPVPSGYRALCSKNLSSTSSSIIRPQKHFDVLLWDGDGSASRDITGLEFRPDVVWIKNRDQASTHSWQDSIIGFGDDKTLRVDTNNVLDTNGNLYGYINHTLPNGFNVNGGSDHGSSRVNSSSSGAKHVAWCWKAGGSSHTYNIDGEGYSSVSAAGLDGGSINPTGASINTKAGFSIIHYTGTGSNATIEHGLGKKPAWVIIKNLNNGGSYDGHWIINHVGLSNQTTAYMHLDGDPLAAGTSNTYFNQTAPTSSVISVGTHNRVNTSGDTYVAYCWAEIPGYSKFGKYKGNFDADGTFINLGFRPAWLMVKKTTDDNFPIYDYKRDPDNVGDHRLFADVNSAEGGIGQEHFDFVSNGIKWRRAKNPFNNSDTTYLYMAFARQPGTTPFDTFPNAR